MDYYQKYKELNRESNILTYTGPLNCHDVAHWKELIERALILQRVENKQRRRIINILIEALQNIHLHGEPDINISANAGSLCLLLMDKQENSYVLIFGNYVRTESAKTLEDRLHRIGKLSLEELKDHYMEMIEKGEITQKGGAGLGLVKMLLESKKNSSYSIKSVNEEYAFFSLELRVSEN